MKQCLVFLDNGQVDVVWKDEKGFIVHKMQGRNAYYSPGFVVAYEYIDNLNFKLEGENISPPDSSDVLSHASDS